MSDDSEPNSAMNREAIEATAAVWLSLRDRGMTPNETEAFMRWLQSDPAHAEAFASLEQTWREFDQLATLAKPGLAPDPDALAPRHRRRYSKLATLSLAAAAVALMGLSLGIGRTQPRRHFAETAIGAVQKVDLPDGSVALLNTDTAIDVDMAARERRVQVVKGEVHFVARHDDQRPFLVLAGTVQVRDIGTAFDVWAGAESIEVLVTQGSVELHEIGRDFARVAAAPSVHTPALLKAGDKVVVAQHGVARAASAVHVTRLSDEQVRRALAWQERRLEFDDTPLADVAAEFNRYNRVKLVVGDTRLAARPFSGTFHPDGYEALVSLLQENFGVDAKRDGDEIRLRLKQAP